MHAGGCRNISNCLSIETRIDLCSEGLREEAKRLGFWDDSRGELNFRLAFSDGELDSRYTCGKQLLEKLSAGGLCAGSCLLQEALLPLVHRHP